MPEADYPPKKRCIKCGEEKPLTQFYKRSGAKDGHRNECSACKRAGARTYRRENYAAIRANVERGRSEVRAYLRALKENPCADCGQTFPHWVMDFHHLRDKEVMISRLASGGYPMRRVKAEVAKCVLLCSNCHRIRHGDPGVYLAGKRTQEWNASP